MPFCLMSTPRSHSSLVSLRAHSHLISPETRMGNLYTGSAPCLPRSTDHNSAPSLPWLSPCSSGPLSSDGALGPSSYQAGLRRRATWLGPAGVQETLTLLCRNVQHWGRDSCHGGSHRKKAIYFVQRKTVWRDETFRVFS